MGDRPRVSHRSIDLTDLWRSSGPFLSPRKAPISLCRCLTPQAPLGCPRQGTVQLAPTTELSLVKRGDVLLFLQTQMVGGFPPSPPLLLPSQRVDFPTQGQPLSGKVSKLSLPFLRTKAELVKSECLPEEPQQHEQMAPVTTLSSSTLNVPGEDQGSSGR